MIFALLTYKSCEINVDISLILIPVTKITDLKLYYRGWFQTLKSEYSRNILIRKETKIVVNSPWLRAIECPAKWNFMKYVLEKNAAP